MTIPRSFIVITTLLSLSLVMAEGRSRAQTNMTRTRVTQAVDMRNLVTLRGNVPPLARQEFDRGVAPDDLPMRRMLMVLQRAPEQEMALRRVLDEQQVKASPQFHQWLTPEEFGQQFGPNDSDLQAVSGWLTSQGFQVAKVTAGRTVIEFSGTAGLVRQVLGTEIHKFRVQGEDHWANVRDPQIPAALASVVAGIDSLNNFPRRPLYEMLGTFSRSKVTGKVQPLFTYPSGPNDSWRALGPNDFATIYNISPLWAAGTDGTGQTIAVVGETNINIQDVRDFRAMFGLPANDPNIILNGPNPGIISDETEADLDVEWAGAVAKGATIDLVVSESTETTQGIDLSALYIVDNNLAPVLSASYGNCEAALAGLNAFYNTLWEQAAAQGITVAVASGDSGSATCDGFTGADAAQFGLGVNGLASTPFNVAVGGTDFNDLANFQTYWNQTNASPGQNSAKSYIPEMPWNDSCAGSGSMTGCDDLFDDLSFFYGFDLVAGGGGPSSCVNPIGTLPNVACIGGGYAKPSWQSGPGVPTDGARDIPDVSLFASNGFAGSFYVICEMDANAGGGGSSSSCDLNSPYLDFQGVGGTSASAQVFAGAMALVTQAHGRQGNANYVFYPLAAQAGNTCVSNAAAVTNTSCIFYDVDPVAGTNVTVNNSVACFGGTRDCSNPNPSSFPFGPFEPGLLVSGSLPAFPTTAGYDLATGLGTVNVANLVNHWTSNFTPTTTSLSLSTSPATHPITLVHGQPTNFMVQATSGSGTPTGDVTLIAHLGSSSSDVTVIGPFELSHGRASGSTVMLPGGSYDVTAHYAGDGTYAAGDSTPGIPVTVTKESSKTELGMVTFDPRTGAASYGATTAVYGSPYALRMEVTNSSGNSCAPADSTGRQHSLVYSCPTGTVTVTPAPADQSPPAGTVPGIYKLNSQGYAEDQPVQLLAGTYPFVASYAGDGSYNASQSPTGPITITKALTTTTTDMPGSVLAGNPLNFTVTTVATSNGALPTGTIQLLLNDGAPIPASGTYSSGQGPSAGEVFIADATNVVLQPGSHTVTANYSGDGNYGSSSSSMAPLYVTDFGISATPSPVTISAPGQTGTSTIQINPLYGFTGIVYLSVASGCPTGAACTFSPSSVMVGSTSPVTSTLTIATMGSASAPFTSMRRVPPSYDLPPAGLLSFLAGMLTLMLLSRWPAMRQHPVALLLGSLLLLAGAWVACGGDVGTPPPPPPAPTVSLSATSLRFTSQNMGTISSAQSVGLTNTGTAVLSIAGFKMAGSCIGDFSQTNTCSSSLASGASCSISVKFAPTATGPRSASVSITDNATGSPHAIGLSGTGVQPVTPPGTYQVVVNATQEGLTHSLPLNVTVE